MLIGLRRDVAELAPVRPRLEAWLAELGFGTRFPEDPREAVDWARRERFAAGFVDAEWELTRGQALWRLLQPILTRRMVLMTQAGQTALWSEALRAGVAAVLPLPPAPASVRAALAAAAGPVPAPHTGRRPPGRRASPD